MAEDESTPLTRIVSGSAVIFVGSIVNKIISFLGSIFIAQLLGDTGYGVVVVALSTYFVLSEALNLGLGNGIARNYPQASDDERRRGVLLSAYQLATLAALVGSVSLFLAADHVAAEFFGDPTIAPVLQVTALILPLKVTLNLGNGTLQAVRKPTHKAAITSILQPSVRIIFIVVLVLAGLGAVGVATAYAIAVGVAALATMYYVYQNTELFAIGRPADRVHKYMLAFSIPLVGSSIILRLMNNVDTLLIGALSTSANVGQYNVAFVLGQATLLFYQTLGFMYIPEVSELYGNDDIDQAGMVYRALTKWVVFVSLPFILTAVVFPEFVLTLIYSMEYQQATVPFMILVAGFLTHLFVGPNQSTLVAFGDTRLILLVDATTVGVNLILNLLLIPVYGIVGAAIATSSSYLIRNIGLTLYLHHSYNLSPFSRWFFLPIVPAVVAAGIISLLKISPSLPVVVGAAALFVSCMALGYLSSGVEEADLLLAELLEEDIGVDLSQVRWLHDRLR